MSKMWSVSGAEFTRFLLHTPKSKILIPTTRLQPPLPTNTATAPTVATNRSLANTNHTRHLCTSCRLPSTTHICPPVRRSLTSHTGPASNCAITYSTASSVCSTIRRLTSNHRLNQTYTSHAQHPAALFHTDTIHHARGAKFPPVDPADSLDTDREFLTAIKADAEIRNTQAQVASELNETGRTDDGLVDDTPSSPTRRRKQSRSMKGVKPSGGRRRAPPSPADRLRAKEKEAREAYSIAHPYEQLTDSERAMLVAPKRDGKSAWFEKQEELKLLNQHNSKDPLMEQTVEICEETPMVPLDPAPLNMEVVMAPGDSRPRIEPTPTTAAPTLDTTPATEPSTDISKPTSTSTDEDVDASKSKPAVDVDHLSRAETAQQQLLSALDAQPWPTLAPIPQLASGLTSTLSIRGVVRVGEDLDEVRREAELTKVLIAPESANTTATTNSTTMTNSEQSSTPRPTTSTTSKAVTNLPPPPDWSEGFATDFEHITHPHLVDLSSTAGFITSSRDPLLLRLARTYDCSVMGSTSSTTKILSHFIFSLGNFHPIQTNEILSPDFETLPKKATSAERAPATLFFRKRREGIEQLKDVESEEEEIRMKEKFRLRHHTPASNNPSSANNTNEPASTVTDRSLFHTLPIVWAIDSEPSWSNPTNRILMELGHTLEAFFTHEPDVWQKVFLGAHRAQQFQQRQSDRLELQRAQWRYENHQKKQAAAAAALAALKAKSAAATASKAASAARKATNKIVEKKEEVETNETVTPTTSAVASSDSSVHSTIEPTPSSEPELASDNEKNSSTTSEVMPFEMTSGNKKNSSEATPEVMPVERESEPVSDPSSSTTAAAAPTTSVSTDTESVSAIVSNGDMSEKMMDDDLAHENEEVEEEVGVDSNELSESPVAADEIPEPIDVPITTQSSAPTSSMRIPFDPTRSIRFAYQSDRGHTPEDILLQFRMQHGVKITRYSAQRNPTPGFIKLLMYVEFSDTKSVDRIMSLVTPTNNFLLTNKFRLTKVRRLTDLPSSGNSDTDVTTTIGDNDASTSLPNDTSTTDMRASLTSAGDIDAPASIHTVDETNVNDPTLNDTTAPTTTPSWIPKPKNRTARTDSSSNSTSSSSDLNSVVTPDAGESESEFYLRQLQALIQDAIRGADNKDKTRDSFVFVKMGNIMFRSQLDCYAPELKGRQELRAFVDSKGNKTTTNHESSTNSNDSSALTLSSWPGWEKGGLVFDLKTRAVLPIRLFCRRYSDLLDYNLIYDRGLLYSFEREYYDMQRSAFLKYSLQCRIGRMGGVMIGYHNTVKVFGFHYVSVKEMDEALFGHTLIGEFMFQQATKIMNQHLTSSNGPNSIIHQIESVQERNWHRRKEIRRLRLKDEKLDAELEAWKKEVTELVEPPEDAEVKQPVIEPSQIGQKKVEEASVEEPVEDESKVDDSKDSTLPPDLSTVKMTIATNDHNSNYVTVFVELLPLTEEDDPEFDRPFLSRYTSQRRVDTLPNYLIRQYLNELDLDSTGNRVAIVSRLEGALSHKPLSQLPDPKVFLALARQNLIHKFVIRVQVSDRTLANEDDGGVIEGGEINEVIQSLVDQYRHQDQLQHGAAAGTTVSTTDSNERSAGARGPPVSSASSTKPPSERLSVSTSLTHISVENGLITAQDLAADYRRNLVLALKGDDPSQIDIDMVKALQMTMQSLIASRQNSNHREQKLKKQVQMKLKQRQAERIQIEETEAIAAEMIDQQQERDSAEDPDDLDDDEDEDEMDSTEPSSSNRSTSTTQPSSKTLHGLTMIKRAIEQFQRANQRPTPQMTVKPTKQAKPTAASPAPALNQDQLTASKKSDDTVDEEERVTAANDVAMNQPQTEPTHVSVDSVDEVMAKQQDEPIAVSSSPSSSSQPSPSMPDSVIEDSPSSLTDTHSSATTDTTTIAREPIGISDDTSLPSSPVTALSQSDESPTPFESHTSEYLRLSDELTRIRRDQTINLAKKARKIFELDQSLADLRQKMSDVSGNQTVNNHTQPTTLVNQSPLTSPSPTAGAVVELPGSSVSAHLRSNQEDTSTSTTANTRTPAAPTPAPVAAFTDRVTPSSKYPPAVAESRRLPVLIDHTRSIRFQCRTNSITTDEIVNHFRQEHDAHINQYFVQPKRRGRLIFVEFSQSETADRIMKQVTHTSRLFHLTNTIQLRQVKQLKPGETVDRTTTPLPTPPAAKVSTPLPSSSVVEVAAELPLVQANAPDDVTAVDGHIFRDAFIPTNEFTETKGVRTAIDKSVQRFTNEGVVSVRVLPHSKLVAGTSQAGHIIRVEMSNKSSAYRHIWNDILNIFISCIHSTPTHPLYRISHAELARRFRPKPIKLESPPPQLDQHSAVVKSDSSSSVYANSTPTSAVGQVATPMPSSSPSTERHVNLESSHPQLDQHRAIRFRYPSNISSTILLQALRTHGEISRYSRPSDTRSPNLFSMTVEFCDWTSVDGLLQQRASAYGKIRLTKTIQLHNAQRTEVYPSMRLRIFTPSAAAHAVTTAASDTHTNTNDDRVTRHSDGSNSTTANNNTTSTKSDSTTKRNSRRRRIDTPTATVATASRSKSVPPPPTSTASTLSSVDQNGQRQAATADDATTAAGTLATNLSSIATRAELLALKKQVDRLLAMKTQSPSSSTKSKSAGRARQRQTTSKKRTKSA